jgi:Siphovirus-type tail component, C-terminal domain
MATLVEWFPADGSAAARFTTGPAAPLRLLRLEGTEPVTVEPVTVKSPNQPGATALDVVVPPRVVTLGGLLQAASPAAAWDLRAALLRSLVQQPTRLGEAYALGRLRVTLDGRAPLELRALPRSSAVERSSGTKAVAPFDLEWLAPDPYWRSVADTQVLFTGAGGFGFAIEYPLEMTSNNVEVEVANAGDVDAPVTARLYGDVTTARIRNLTTGEVLEITGNIASGEYVEVSTAFGDKRVELVDAGTGERTSVMDRINLAKPDFWALRPGLNVVTFEADVNVSGRAELYWRQRQSGF